MYCGVLLRFLLVFLWPTGVVSNTGDSGVPGSHKTLIVQVDDDAILPCQLETPFDNKTQKVEWTRNDKQDVHLYRKGKDDLTNQDQHFHDRTALFRNEMAKGNISLKLSKVNEQDEGNYTCRVDSSQDPQCNILLSVEKKSDTEERKKAGSESKPEPKKGWGKKSNTDDQKKAESKPETDNRNLGFIALVIPVIVVVLSIWWKYRNNNAAPNGDNKLEGRKETNEENQRDPVLDPMLGGNGENLRDPDTVAPEARPGPVPVPGPNNDHVLDPMLGGNGENLSGPDTGIPMVPLAGQRQRQGQGQGQNGDHSQVQG